MNAENFDVVEFINKTFQEYTLYEINDSLAVLAKSIAKTAQESKEMVSAHFSEFVKCRSILDGVWEDMKRKGLDKLDSSAIDRSISKAIEKFKTMSSGINASVNAQQYNSRRLYFSNEFREIFELKENLRANLGSLDRFVEIYTAAKKQLERAPGSVFLQKKFEEARPEISEFLERIVVILLEDNVPFEEAVHYLDLYFAVGGGRTEHKIASTLLVSFKESMAAMLGPGEEYLDYLIAALRRLNRCKNREIIVEGISYAFDCVFNSLKGQKLPQIKISLKRLYEARAGLGLSAETAKEYGTLHTGLKERLFNVAIAEGDPAMAVAVYDSFKDTLIDSEHAIFKEALMRFAIAWIEKKELGYYEYLEEEAVGLRKVRGILEAQQRKQLNAFLREYKNKAIVGIAKEYSEFIKERCEPWALMEATKIVKRSPTFSKDILFEAKSEIAKKPILFYFLYRFLRAEKPVLDAADLERAKELEYQFGFLMEGQ